MNNKKQKEKKVYQKIVKKSKYWPIVKLFSNRQKFMDEVSLISQEKLKKKLKEKSIIEEIKNTLYREKLRISKIHWKADPADDKIFWSNIEKEITNINYDENISILEQKLLSKIINRYTKEITGNFKRTHYSFTRRLIIAFFARLLNTARLRNPFGNLDLDSKINIIGKIKKLRKLSKIGTIVMVPTHFTHLDSALIGWTISHLGLPAFMYGAGLVLYNMNLFSYFFNSLGAYKVDRRKKHLLYLETLKTYTQQAIINDCHNLFYPGGTRSRSGSIEEKLKLGLLKSALDAQKELDNKNKKIFIVPVTFNYQFILEAPALINQHISSSNPDKFYLDDLGYSNSFKIITFLIKFFSKSNRISVSFGQPMDIYGNSVNKKGSISKNNKVIFNNDYSKKAEILNTLSKKIVQEHKSGTQVFSSMLIAFLSFEIINNKYKRLELYNIFKLPNNDLEIEVIYFTKFYNKAIKVIQELASNNKIKLSDEINYPIDKQIKIGCENLGLYHPIRPVQLKNNIIKIKNIKMLYYYHNRLVGFNIEKIFNN
ncbi:MAG: 1-acyl-sn-glycerol-3-phosphate acyltransferase [Bacteroidota bacterium]|nr:1-acyl-sn-glycerol-3-phosphate acyltransferase [Bacteroidota bacterium]